MPFQKNIAFRLQICDTIGKTGLKMGPSVREGQMKGGYREMESGLGASFFRVHDKSEEREKKGRGGGGIIQKQQKEREEE